MFKKVIYSVLVSLFIGTSFGTYVKDYVPVDFSIIILVFGAVSLKFLISYGISTVFLFFMKVLLVQSILMTFFNWITPDYYEYTKIVSLLLAPLAVVLGFNKFKSYMESVILVPLGLIKKKYDNTFNNISKDNAGLNLTIEQIDSLGNNGILSQQDGLL